MCAFYVFNQYASLDLQNRYKRMKKSIPRGLEKWNGKRTER